MHVPIAATFALLCMECSTYTEWSYTNESDSYYGQSPAVYASPATNGSSNSRWAAAYAQASEILAQLTLEGKVITHGFPGTCVGNSGAVSRLRWQPLCLSDAPDGIRVQEFTSAFPAGIHVAAAFDKSLMYTYGVALGEEFRGKGINYALGPVAGLLGRVARGGHNWEGLSPDPYLAGAAMSEITGGTQDINNSYGCQNSKILNGIPKTELGFEGVVMSDWDAQHSGVAFANAGLDLVMPDSGFWGGNLTEAVRHGSVSESRLDDMVLHNHAPYFYVGQSTPDYPAPNVHASTQKAVTVNVQSAAQSDLIRDIGFAGTVLVKNVNNTLPLQNSSFLNIYGYDAELKAVPTVSLDAYPQDTFAEGVWIDYRAFDKDGIEPRYESGFGMSYTTFEYSGLQISEAAGNSAEYPDPNIQIIQGGHPELWETLYNVTISVTNTGGVFGHDVPQLYVGIPDAPVRQLRGFERVSLQPGETESVVFPLTRRDLSIWDVVMQQWRLQRGQYGMWVGASSRDLRLNGTLEVGAEERK